MATPRTLVRSLFTLCVAAALVSSWLIAGSQADPSDDDSQAPAAALGAADDLAAGDYVGPDACRACHEDIHTHSRATAHFRDSSFATSKTVFGSFERGENVLPTKDPAAILLMESRNGELTQSVATSVNGRPVRLRTEELAVAVGATKGQTYLYWKGDLLHQLPASYLASAGSWIYSPGYPEGEPHFDRPIPPQCLDCHATHIEVVSNEWVVKPDDDDDWLFGITCEKCHGPGGDHVRFHTEHPAETRAVHMTRIADLDRDRQLDLCGFCHSGATIGEPKQPPFTFRPGDRLADHFEPKSATADARPEVHSNQVALLRASRCFQASDSMTCQTCHGLHRHERGDAATFAARCLACHSDDACSDPEAKADGCVDCHMPLADAKGISFESNAETLTVPVRNHRIGIYRQ